MMRKRSSLIFRYSGLLSIIDDARCVSGAFFVTVIFFFYNVHAEKVPNATIQRRIRSRRRLDDDW